MVFRDRNTPGTIEPGWVSLGEFKNEGLKVWIFFTWWCYCKVWMDMDACGGKLPQVLIVQMPPGAILWSSLRLLTRLVLYQVFPEDYPRDHLIRDSKFVIWTRQALVFVWFKLAQVWEIPWIMWYCHDMETSWNFQCLPRRHKEW